MEQTPVPVPPPPDYITREVKEGDEHLIIVEMVQKPMRLSGIEV